MKVIVKNARMSFNDLYEPKSVKGGESSFSITLLCSDDTTLAIDGEDGKKKILPFPKMEAICEKVAKEKFGGKLPPKLKNWVFNQADGSGTREAFIDEKTGKYWQGADENTWYISAKKRADKVPGGKLKILDQEKNPIEANSGKLFSGCYVNCIIQVYAMDSEKGGKLVTASLEAVQLLRKGEPLGFTQVDAESEFDSEEVEVDESAGDSENDVDDML